MFRMRQTDVFHVVTYKLTPGKNRGHVAFLGGKRQIEGQRQRGVAVAQWGFYDTMMQDTGDARC
jgi:hypothetical protein